MSTPLDALSATAPLLEVQDVRVTFPRRGSGGVRPPRGRLVAVDGLSLSMARGECVGIVGESGCGKSTLLRAIVGLQKADSGQVRIAGRPIDAIQNRARRIQLVFQDPFSALNPAMKIGHMLGELIRVHKLAPRRDIRTACGELLREVGLSEDFLDVRPQALSGGQRQRIGIARALALRPDIILADEIVSALDVSVQAEILNLLFALREELGLTMLFISHNLAVVRQICDRALVMHGGKIVEEGSIDEVFSGPKHGYTKQLLSSVPRIAQ